MRPSLFFLQVSPFKKDRAMPQKKHMSAGPNARVIIEMIGREMLWHEMAMMFGERIRKPRQADRQRSGLPYEMQFLRIDLPQMGPKATATLIYDFGNRQIRGEFVTPGFKIRETEIVVKNLPDALLRSAEELSLSDIVTMDHLKERDVVDITRSYKTKTARFKLSEPDWLEISPAKKRK